MAVEMHSVLTDQQMAAVMSEVIDKAEVHNYEKQVQLAPRDQPLIFSTGLDSPPSPASLFSVTPRPLPHSRFIGPCPQVLEWQNRGPEEPARIFVLHATSGNCLLKELPDESVRVRRCNCPG